MRKINILKHIFVLAIFLCLGFMSLSTIASSETETLVVNGSTIKYRTTGEAVKINKVYDPTGGEFRAVWVSALTSDISGYTTEAAYKKQMIDVIENMEAYNLNVMIFHVRMMNDAFYKSKYNSWSSYYNTNPDCDMLPWLIEECHKRGIEFHAWMNPYRVTTNVAQSLEECAAKFKSANAASKASNLLKASSCIILNPGEPEVRDFLVDTCMELVQNYDIDAIHFDDYFYAAGIDDSATVAKYNTEKLSIDAFRRKQVDLFIEDLHNQLTDFNNQTGRRVQLGIAPTGVYRNGSGIVTYDNNGNAMTNGSKTSAYAHYGSPLYADTVKWINNGWIDYMLPQTYWAITNSAGPYCDLVKWWNDVCAYKKTNLYSSLGLYMSIGGGNASWGYNKKEGYQQIMFANSLEHVRGCSIYNYLSMASSLNGDSMMQGVKNIWNKAIYLPEIRTVDQIIPGKVTGLSIEKTNYGNKLSFDSVDKAKFYVIYRSDKELTYNENEIIDVIGGTSELIEYTDNITSDKVYNYGVKVQSHSLTLGEGVSVSTENIKQGSNMSLGKIPNITLSDNLVQGEVVSLRFDNLYYPYGSNVKYSLNYSFKNGDEVIDSKNNLSTTFVNGKNCFDFNIPQNATALSIEIVGSNNRGETIEKIDKQIHPSLGKLNNMIIKGSNYSNQLVELTFPKIQSENVQYTVQKSYDGFSFEDYYHVTTTSDLRNIRTQFNLSKDSGKVYYRVKAELDNAQSYSNIILINQINYIGQIQNVSIQNKDDYQISVNEYDDLIIKWKQLNADTTYICYFSNDLQNWSSIKMYDNASSAKLTGDVYTQTIPINYKYMKFYLKIVGVNKHGETESDIITVTVNLEMLFSDEVSEYLIKNNEVFINNMDILK